MLLPETIVAATVGVVLAFQLVCVCSPRLRYDLRPLSRILAFVWLGVLCVHWKTVLYGIQKNTIRATLFLYAQSDDYCMIKVPPGSSVFVASASMWCIAGDIILTFLPMAVLGGLGLVVVDLAQG